MGLRYDEIELTDSAYRHGYEDEDVAEMLRGPHLVILNRRGRLEGYELFGRGVPEFPENCNFGCATDFQPV